MSEFIPAGAVGSCGDFAYRVNVNLEEHKWNMTQLNQQ